MSFASTIYTFEWDPKKARSNAAKHGVSFALAQEAWDDFRLLVRPDRVVDGEERWHGIGRVSVMTLLFVVHTYPDPDDELHVRIISARRANREERRDYDAQTF